MKLVSILALPLLAAFAPAVGAQAPADVAHRVANQIQKEVQVGFAELDATFLEAERRLIQLSERGASERVLRMQVELTRQAFLDTTLVCTRTVRIYENHGIQLLTRMGALQYWVPWLQSTTTRQLNALEQHEAMVFERIEAVLERLL